MRAQDATIAFHYIGLWNFFIEARNLLSDDGVLLTTTPNAVGYLSINNAIQQRPPQMFGLHVHELTAHELRALHAGAGFRVLVGDSRDAFAIRTPPSHFPPPLPFLLNHSPLDRH